MLQNKTLLAFPILTAVLSVFLVLLFLTPVAFERTGYSYGTAEHWKAVANNFYSVQNETSSSTDASGSHSFTTTRNFNAGLNGVKPLGLAYFAVTYFATMFLATFLNVAFYHEILNALRGQPVSMVSGLQFATTKWKIILLWTLFAGLVGLIIKILEERVGFVGQWILRLIGAVWSIACVFVIPVIITEEQTANPFVVLKKSATILTKTWGESLIGYVGVSLGGSLIMGLSAVWLVAAISGAVVLHSLVLGIAAVVIWLAAIIVLNYLMSVASQIFRCALFLYASQGSLPEPYTQEMMNMAWKVKKG